MKKYITNYKMIKTAIIFLLMFASKIIYAQPPIQWQKCYGGSIAEGAYATVPTTDGGYITIGDSRSNDIDVSGQHGISDIWVVKTDVTGNIQWQKCFGGS